jgi:hypothetical protein
MRTVINAEKLIEVGLQTCADELLKNHRDTSGNPTMADVIREAQEAQALKSANELRPVFVAIAAMVEAGIAQYVEDLEEREYQSRMGDDL